MAGHKRTARTPPSNLTSRGAYRRNRGTSSSTSATPPSRPFPTPSTPDRARAQYEANSAGYLKKLFRIAKRRAAPDYEHPDPWPSPCANRGRRPSGSANTPGAMADFLASFRLGAETQAPAPSKSCRSVDELQSRLHDELQAKTTPTRAEHVSLALELHGAVQFTLLVSHGENRALEGLEMLDPLLGGISSNDASIDVAGESSRVVSATETLTNQSDNPVLQRTVAKHIIGAVSAADESSWVLRDLSRGQQGWTFTYICKDSHQHWSRQNSKNPTKAIIGEYSLKELDPTLASRPAFDCRGSAVIAFERNNRLISVKYDHTLLHKTVAQLSELYPHPERQLGPGAIRQLQQKTPKKSEKKKKKRYEPKTGDESGQQSKKRKKKNNGEAQPLSPMIPPDIPGTTSTDAGSNPTWSSQDIQNHDGNEQGFDDYPPGLVDDNATISQSAQGAAVANFLPFKVSPDEAARRMAIATKILNDAGVSPDTLSSEQMNIFANQSPELQNDSVAMLAKYGAERLQIIHPSSKDKSGLESTNTSDSLAQTTSGVANATPTTTKELSLQDNSRGEVAGTGRSRKSGADSKSKRTPGKSRLACLECKSRRVKCPRERPTCKECEAEGRQCEYPTPTPRVRKSDVVVEMRDDGEVEAENNEEPSVEPQQDQQLETQDEDLESQDVSHSQMAVATMLPQYSGRLAPDPQSQHSDYFQSDAVTMPQSDLNHLSQRALSSASGLALPQGHIYKGQEPSMDTSTSVYPQAGLQPNAQSASPKPKERQPRTSTDSARRTAFQTASVPPNDGQAVASVAPATSWLTAHTSFLTPGITRDHTASQNYVQSAVKSQQPSHPSATTSPRLQDSTTQPVAATGRTLVGMQQGQSPQQPADLIAAMQAKSRKTPFQAPGHQRARSRQGRRSHTRTPTADQSMNHGARPPPPQNQSTKDTAASWNQPQNLVASSYSNHTQRASATNIADVSNPTVSNGVGYEPLSHTRTGSSTQTSRAAYDYGRTTQSTAPTLNPAAISTANQWSRKSQDHQSRSYDNQTMPYDTSSNSYLQHQNTAPASISAHHFDMRGAAQPKAAGSNASKRPHAYSQYPSNSQSHQQPPSQPSDQQMGNNHEWYGFNGANTNSFPPANHGWLQ